MTQTIARPFFPHPQHRRRPFEVENLARVVQPNPPEATGIDAIEPTIGL